MTTKPDQRRRFCALDGPPSPHADDLEPQEQTAQTTFAAHADIAAEAEQLYDAGMNVFPVIRGSKEPYGSHTILTTTRLHKPSLPGLVRGSNIAVMTGRTSGNLFGLDCDSWKSFVEVGESLEALGIFAWIRNGIDGGQYWLQCEEGEVANGKAGDVDILGNRKYTVAPPSIHPSGMIYEWIRRGGSTPPRVSLDRLVALGLGLDTVSRRRVRGKQHELPVVANRVLVEQDTTGYHSNSEAEFAACLSLLGVGYSNAEIMRFFGMFPPPHYTKVGEDHFKASVLDQARQKQMPLRNASHNRSQKPGSLHSSVFLHWAESRPWPGRTGNTDRAVYLALCQRMRMDGGCPFRASVREVAELAAINKETAYKAMSRLVKAGLVRPEDGNSNAGSSRYSLFSHVINNDDDDNDGTSLQNRTVGEAYTPVGTSVRIWEAHDAWHRDALGKSALAVWTVMRADQGMTEVEIAERTGKTVATIRRALAKLEPHGLAYAEHERWWSVDAFSGILDLIAFRAGTLGRADQRTQGHRGERERHATAIIEQQKRDWLARQ